MIRSITHLKIISLLFVLFLFIRQAYSNEETEQFMVTEDDSITHIALSDNGEIYLSGKTNCSNVVYKFDASMNPVWQYHYIWEGASLFNNGLELDPDGNIYWLMGISCTLTKLSSDGELIWQRGIDDPFKEYFCSDMGISENGDAVLSGSHESNDTNETVLFLKKYDPEGVEQWEESFPIPPWENISSGSIIFDREGNIYTNFSYTWSDYYLNLYRCSFMVKFDSGGGLLWRTDFEDLKPAKMALFDNNNVAALAYSLLSGDSDKILFFNEAGSPTWIIEVENYVLGDIVVDSENSFFLAGATIGPKSHYTVAYDTGGNLKWNDTFAFPGTGDQGAAYVLLDHEENVISVGGVYYWKESEIALLKYSNSGQRLWETVYAEKDNNLGYRDAEIDLFGNIYLAGDVVYQDERKDWLMLKIDSEGNVDTVYKYDSTEFCNSLPDDDDDDDSENNDDDDDSSGDWPPDNGDGSESSGGCCNL